MRIVNQIKDFEMEITIRDMILNGLENIEKFKLDVSFAVTHEGMDMNKKGNEGHTFLHLALILGQYHYARELLVTFKADPRIKTKTGKNILHLMAMHIDTSDFDLEHEPVDAMWKILMRKHKSGLNKPDYKGNTPIHYAAKQRCSKCIALLRNAGAVISIKNMDGKIPQELVNGHIECYNLLQLEFRQIRVARGPLPEREH